MHKLERFLDNQNVPIEADAHIIDAMYFLHLQKKLDHVTVLKDCRLYLTVNNVCVCFTAVDDSVQKDNVQELMCYHEEADTCMVFHLEFISKVQSMTSIVIRSCDTDVLVIFCYNLASTDSEVDV